MAIVLRQSFPKPSPIDGSRGQLMAVDVRTDAAYGKNVKQHTVSDVVTFVKEYKAYLAKFNRTLKVLRFDRGPELATPQTRAALADLGLAVEVAPRGRHQGVARVEGKMDPVDRLTDALLERARHSRGMRLEARMAAIDLINLRAAPGRDQSRIEHLTGRAPPLKDHLPFAWGCRVNALEDEQARGASRGKGHQGRSSPGLLLRVNHGEGFRVLKDNGHVVYPPDVTPLYEPELLRRGFPAAAAQTDAAVNTPSDGRHLALLRNLCR